MTVVESATTTPTDLNFRICDADNHYYEPEDCFSRYAPSTGPILTRRVENDRVRLYAGDRRVTYISNPTFDRVASPGALRQLFDTVASGDVAPEVDVDYGELAPPDPAFVRRDARLEVMDEQGVEAVLMLPTLGVVVEQHLQGSEETYGALRAFNAWLHDDWGFGTDGRIFAAPLMSLADPDLALEQLEWVLERGARFVHIRPAPAGGGSPADRIHDRFWATANEAELVVVCHQSDSGYNASVSALWGEQPDPPSQRRSAFQHVIGEDRPVMDMVANLVFHNLFGRFPKLRLASIENGSAWVPYLLESIDKAMAMGRRGPWPGGKLTELPSEVVRRHVFVAPYPEEDPLPLVEQLGVSQVLFGSDYPHPEGLANPREYAARLAPLGLDARRQIMRDNLATLIGR